MNDVIWSFQVQAWCCVFYFQNTEDMTTASIWVSSWTLLKVEFNKSSRQLYYNRFFNLTIAASKTTLAGYSVPSSMNFLIFLKLVSCVPWLLSIFRLNVSAGDLKKHFIFIFIVFSFITLKGKFVDIRDPTLSPFLWPPSGISLQRTELVHFDIFRIFQ